GHRLAKSEDWTKIFGAIVGRLFQALLRFGVSQKRPTNIHMKVAAAQISCVLGARAANLGKVCDFASHAKRAGAELSVFPEMIDTGYSMPTIKQHAAPWQED